MLLHTEHSLLSLLKGMEGVVQKHDFFTELCLHEEEVSKNFKKWNYIRFDLQSPKITNYLDEIIRLLLVRMFIDNKTLYISKQDSS